VVDGQELRAALGGGGGGGGGGESFEAATDIPLRFYSLFHVCCVILLSTQTRSRPPRGHAAVIFCACIGSPCLRRCTHGAPVGGGGGRLLAELDTDGDGVVSQAEFQRAMAQVSIP
jgi:hypothetical protein